MKFIATFFALALALSTTTALASDDEDWSGIEPFTLHASSLQGAMDVDAKCEEVWDVLTVVEKLKELAPHLHITSPVIRAHERGDYVNIEVVKDDHISRGKFVLLTPVPFHRVDAVVQPEKGPWMRIQVWNVEPQSEDKCRVDYSEAYNEIWLKEKRIDGSRFIADNRDHHVHVILRRIKNMAEGNPPGSEEEYSYLFEDARNFPIPFQRPMSHASR